ncbi:ER membrane protein complex subunit 8 [Lemmus lemmus]
MPGVKLTTQAYCKMVLHGAKSPTARSTGSWWPRGRGRARSIRRARAATLSPWTASRFSTAHWPWCPCWRWRSP